MEQNESVQFFLRSLNEKHNQFKSNFKIFFTSLVGENIEEKKKTAEIFYNSALELKNHISNKDTPSWLSESISAIQSFLDRIDQLGAKGTLLHRILPFYAEANSYQWHFEDPQKILAFDFDSIYEKCKGESRVDEYFDAIISTLKNIIDSEEIDSIKLKRTLETLIARLKNHKSASYLSLYGTWGFISRLMTNILWEELEKIPAIGPIVKGLRKTMEEAAVELKDLNEKLKKEMNEKYNGDYSFLNSSQQNLLENHNHE
jgi:hypothetical protein